MFKQRWYDKEVKQHVNSEVVKRLYKTAFIVEGEIKQVITEKGLIYSGLYRDTITHEMHEDELMVRVGSPINNPPYPLFLEVGTSRGIPAHAPMRIGLANSKERVKAVWR